MAAQPALADLPWSNDCKYDKNIEVKLDVHASERLAIVALAGTLNVKGHSDPDQVIVRGHACASKEALLDEVRIETSGGESALVEVHLPDTYGGWSLVGKSYAFLDLELDVPEGLYLDIRDSSGSMDLAGIGSARIRDSSGSMEIADAAGPLSVEDSSGSISFDRIRGDVTIEADSSGSISGRDIKGSVLVKRDSSGSIRFSDVSGDFVVERDSSGSIAASGIGGDFVVLKDGSGGIHSDNVAGEISLPSH